LRGRAEAIGAEEPSRGNKRERSPIGRPERTGRAPCAR
jgi:hypothetical protein